MHFAVWVTKKDAGQEHGQRKDSMTGTVENVHSLLTALQCQSEQSAFLPIFLVQ